MSKPAEKGAPSPILITMGEPAGVGPEVAAKAWRILAGRVGERALMFVGEPKIFRRHGAFSDDVFWPAEVTRARVDSSQASQVVAAIDIAVAAAMSKEAAAIVTAPINKAMLLEAGFNFAGHTEYLAKLSGATRAVMMLAGGGLRVIPLTIHISLVEAARAISQTAIIETAEIVLGSLARDFSLAQPRLAIAGLNPHAGELGNLGREESEIIAPAADVLRARGHCVLGPLPADTMFHTEARAGYDAALCMYHDQALIPLKTLAFWEGVNITLGLPIVRTSPDHGTAMDIAGRDIADPRSMIAAIQTAAAIADARGL